jgi:NAD(P)-dependent dehydrogenase (short-subunit alcohol dehydrogenase family)
MENSYADTIVLLTGGTSGIGKATALAFAQAGAKVFITAVEGLTRAVAQGIRVNAVAPGSIDTDMVGRFSGDVRNWLVSQHPVGRLGTSEEIAAAVPHLASDAAKFTSGTILSVDGEWTASVVGAISQRRL